MQKEKNISIISDRLLNSVQLKIVGHSIAGSLKRPLYTNRLCVQIEKKICKALKFENSNFRITSIPLQG